MMIIDDFSVGAPPLTVINHEGVFPLKDGMTVQSPMILGGEFDTVINLVSAELGDGASVEIKEGLLHYTQDASCTAVLIFHYDGYDGSWEQVHASTGLGGGIDITNGGTYDRIRVKFLNNVSSFVMAVVLFTDQANSSEAKMTVPVSADPFTVEYLFEGLVHQGNGADLTNVRTILFLAGSGGGMTGLMDFEIDGIWARPADETPPPPLEGGIVELLGISHLVPPAQVVANDEPTEHPTGSSWLRTVPNPPEKIYSMQTLLLDMDQAAIDWVFGELFPRGEGPAGLTLWASSGLPPQPGRYFLAITQVEERIPLRDTTLIRTYAAAFDSDGQTWNNYQPWPDYPYDFYAGVDKVYEIQKYFADEWTFEVLGVRQNAFDPVGSSSVCVINGPELAFFIPSDELGATWGWRATSHACEDDYGMSGGHNSMDIHPTVTEGLEPGPVGQAIVVEPTIWDGGLYVSESPPCKCECPNGSVGLGMHISIGRGTLSTDVPVCRVESAQGPTIDFRLHYDSGKADGSVAKIQTVLGPGWTHNYNIYLIDESQDVFLADVTGRMTRFHKNGGEYVASPGETHELSRVGSDTFLLRELNGSMQTFNRFTQPPWPVVGEFYQLTQITATNGQTTTLSYDELGRLSTITDPFGRRVTLSYHASSNLLIAIQNADGANTQIHYTEQNIGRILDPLGNSLEFSYDAEERMLTEKKKDGNTWTCQYNSSSKPQKLIDSEGQVLVTVTNSSNWAVDENELLQSRHVRYVPGQTTVTDGEGNVTHYAYDHNGYITGVQHVGHPETEYQYDENLRLTAQTDEKGNTWRYGRDQYGNTTSIEDPLGNVTLMLYEHPSLKSLMTKKIEPDDDVWRYVYDSKGNLEQEIDPMVEQLENRIVSHTYDEQGFRTSTTDRNGHVTQWQYHPDGTLAARIVDPEGLFIVTEYKYDEAGRKTEETLYRGSDFTDPVTTQYTYDALGNLVSQVVDPNGLNLATRYRYDGEGRVTHQTNPKGVTTEYHYDARGRLHKQIADPGGLGLVTERSYDNAGNLIKLIDPEGSETQYEYDDQNRLVKIIDAEGYWTVYEYDERDNRTYVKRSIEPGGPPFQITQFRYDKLDRRTHEILDPDGLVLVTEFEYSLPGGSGCACGTPGSSLVHKTIDPAGKITYYYYDKLDRLIHEVSKVADSADNGGDADDVITRYEYDFMGNQTSVTMENDPYPDRVTTYTYDAADRLVEQVQAPGGSALATTYVYDRAGNLIQETTPLGNLVNSVYDKANRMIEQSDTIGVIASYTYDENGNMLTLTDGLGRTQSYTYDNVDRRIEMYDPLVETPSDKHMTYTYDKNGNLIQQTDNEGLITRYTYDGLGRRLTEIRDLGGLGITITRAYNGRGNLIEITDDNGNTTRYEYDAVGRRTREIYADDTDVSFAYDKVGNVITRTDQMDNQTTYSYDDLHRLTAQTYANGHTDTFTYDRVGGVLTADNDYSHIGYAYDDVGRVISSTQADRLQSYSYTVQYAYSTSPNERTIIYPGGKIVKEVYDVRGRLADVDVGGIKATWYTYDDPGNQILSRSFANNTHAEYAHNDNGWVAEISHLDSNQLPIVRFAYDYDAMGNRLNAKHVGTPRLVPDPIKPVTLSEKYEYDAIYRLIDFKRGSWGAGGIDSPTRHRTWQLDGVGNWSQFSIDAETYTNSINQMNEYDDWSTDGLAPIPDDDGLPDDFKQGHGSGFNRAHDKNGNLVADDTKEYYYDYDHRPIMQATRRANNQLTQVGDSKTGAILGQYWYDALGRRIRKLVEGVSTVYIYTTDWQVIEEYKDQALTATYTYGNYIDEVLTMERGEQTFYYHQNAIWSVIAVTDNGGDVVELYAYDPYGNPHIADRFGVPVTPDPEDTPQSTIGNPYLFTGRRHDNEDNLYHYRSRYLDPMIGRFLTPDSIGIWGDPYNLGNGFSYAGNNPLSLVDSSGMSPLNLKVTANLRPKYEKSKKKRPGLKFKVVKNPNAKARTTPEGCKEGCERVQCDVTVDLYIHITYFTKADAKHQMKHAQQLKQYVEKTVPGKIDKSSWNEDLEKCLPKGDPRLGIWQRKCEALDDAVKRVTRGVSKKTIKDLMKACKQGQKHKVEREARDVEDRKWPKDKDIIRPLEFWQTWEWVPGRGLVHRVYPEY
ncbi:MAG: RHS repeat-associated core domain-containing protein [Phycisphaerales bacterium]|nr:MAG: RHS repeat-associated core domain-containing protein [Phycisphaerales bacterium]